MSEFKGKLVQTYGVAMPAPLGRNSPEAHKPGTVPVTRDDAPQGVGGVDPLLVDHSSWFTDAPVQVLAGPERVRRGHDLDGQTHRIDDDNGSPAPEQLVDVTRVDYGGHRTAVLAGVNVPPGGGLRGDNSLPHSNPDGYRQGTDYQLVQSDRRMMPIGFMRGMFRHVRTGQITASQGATERTAGPARPTQRHNITSGTDVVAPVAEVPTETTEWAL